MTQKPALTIALPVYNGGSSVAVALTSLLAQSFTDFNLIIFDNASTDQTEEISAAFAGSDHRVIYRRRPSLIPAYENFRLALDRVTTPYFMFAAADDFWEPTYVERNMAQLLRRPDAAASCSQVKLVDPDGVSWLSRGTGALDGSLIQNLINYLADPSDNSRFYGVFRTAALQRAFSAAGNVFAGDWLVMALTLESGGHLEVSEVLMVRDATPQSRHVNHAAASARGPISRIVPVASMMRLLVRALPGNLVVRLLPTLAGLTVRSMVNSPIPSARAFVMAASRGKRLVRRRW